MKVALLTGSLSRAGGGVYEIVRALSLSLRRRSVDVGAFGLADVHTDADRAGWAGIPVSACDVRGPRAFGYAPDLSRRLAAFDPDVVHQHGLWIYPSWVGRRWKARSRRIHVITPQGMLEPWVMKHHGGRKRIAWAIHERSNLRSADCINVNSEAELGHLRELGIETPACIVANGVDLPAEDAPSPPPPWADRWGDGAPVLLYLGRLHPKKGVLELVEGWKAVSASARAARWRLAILGWDQQGHGSEVNARIAALGLEDSVAWFGPAYGGAKSAALRSAAAFALPSYSEGLPMAVLEAWAHRLPVLMTRECNLERGFAAGAAIEVRPEPASLASGLQQLFALEPGERAAIGRRGRELVEANYTWPQIAAELHSVYAWCRDGGDKPACVRLGEDS